MSNSVQYVLWAHHINDQSWTDTSYIKIFTCTTINEFWQLMNSVRTEFKVLENYMLFFMKSINNVDIMPRWEDEMNKKGGCWSMKIIHEEALDNFIDLAVHFVTDNISVGGVNGISIAPKKKTHNNENMDEFML